MYTQMWGGYGKWRCVTNSVKKVCKSKRRVDEVDITKAWKNKISLPNPDNLIYIPCNPLTFVRDMQILNKIYNVDEFYYLEMFPRTKHMECISILSRKAQ